MSMFDVYANSIIREINNRFKKYNIAPTGLEVGLIPEIDYAVDSDGDDIPYALSGVIFIKGKLEYESKVKNFVIKASHSSELLRADDIEAEAIRIVDKAINNLLRAVNHESLRDS